MVLENLQLPLLGYDTASEPSATRGRNEFRSPSYVFITTAVVSRWMWLFFINNWNPYAGQLKCIVLLGMERNGCIKLVSFLRIVHSF